MRFSKNKLYIFAGLLILLMFLGSFVFAGGGEDKKAEEEDTGVVTLTFANDKGWTDKNDKLSPYSEEAIGVAFVSESTPDPANYQALMKQALAGKNPPDILNWWSKYRLEDLVSLDLVEDLTDIWEKHIDAGEYDRSVINEFMVDGKAYGFMYISMFWTVMYNKTVFQRFNLDEPETWDEFLAVCETLKQGGVIPIATTAEGRWYSMVWFEEVLIRTDPDVYEGVLERKIKYSDPRVKKAMGYWKELIDKGYFAADVTPGFAEVVGDFAAGDVGMYLIGDWAVGNFIGAGMEPGKDLDFFIMPNIDPKAGKVIVFETAPLCVAKNSPNKEAALRLADYWLSPEAQTIWASIWVHATTNKKATQPDNTIINKFDELGLMTDYRFVTRFYEGTPVPICEYALDKLTEFMLHPDRMDQILEDIDKYIASQ